MSPIDRAKTRRIAALAILASLTVLFWRFAVAWIFEPMAWLFWAAWRVLTSLDQGICWAILVVICAALVMRLALVVSHSFSDVPAQPAAGRVAEDRLARWERLAAGLETRPESRAAFRASLEPLALSVAEMTRTPLPPAAPDGPGSRPGTWLSRLLPGYRRRSDMRRIEDLLAALETALEIKHEPDSGSDDHP